MNKREYVKWGGMIVASVLLSVIVVGWIGSPSSATTSQHSTLDRIHETHVIHACYMVWSSAVMKDPNTGELSGHLIDAIEYIAQEVGAEIEYTESTWGTFPLSLESRQCDIVTAGIFSTIPRAYNASFTRPIFFTGINVVTTPEFIATHPGLTSITDFDIPGIRVAVGQGYAEEQYAKQVLTQTKIQSLSTADLTLPMLEVSNGNADIAIVDTFTIQQYLKNHPELVVALDKPFNSTGVSWAVRQDDTQFLQFINTSLEFLITTGKMEEFELKYGATWEHPAIIQE